MKIYGEIVCETCGVTAPKTGPASQKYCRPCSDAANERRRRALRPFGGRRDTSKVSADTTTMNEFGARVSKKEQKSILNYGDEEPKFSSWWRFSLPFNQAGSKNHLYSLNGRGHIYLRAKSRSFKDEVALLAKRTLAGHRLMNNKIWIEIFVQKPNHRSDAINLIDSVCDGLKVGFGVDDRWFSLRCVDWQISKTNPRIFIGFGQENQENAIACSSCGRILPYSNFHKNTKSKHGVTRVCKDCYGALATKPRRNKAKKPMQVLGEMEQ